MFKWLRTRVQPPETKQNVADVKTEVNGDNNNVVNVVVQGGGTWPLPMRTTLWTDAPQNRENVAALLRWNTRLSPLVGRIAELAQLNDWANSEHPVSIQLICAPGGQGKTRLAAEFATGLDGWRHGWVDLDDFSQAELLTWQGRCLLLVDYPEHKPTQLEHLARAVERAVLQTGQRLRIVLVAREANTVQSVFQNRASSSWLQPPLVLPELPREAGHGMVNNALDWLASFYGCALTAVSLEAFEAWRARHALHQNPLFVTALAIDLAIRSDERSSVDTWLSGPDLLGALVQKEIQWWQKAAAGFGAPSGALTTVMAWATLSGQLTDSDINQTLAPVHGWSANDLQAVHASLAAACRRVGDHGWAPLEPDLLAAYFVDFWLSGAGQQGRENEDSAVALTLLHIGNPAQFEAHMNRLNMLSYDQKVRLMLRSSSDTHCLENFIGRWAAKQPQLLAELGRCFDRGIQYVGLSWLASNVSRQQLHALGFDVSDKERAQRLNNLSNRLSEVGQHQEALTSAQKSVAIYRCLAKIDPVAYDAGLAMGLSNLADRLSQTGDWIEALDRAKEAEEIYRRLAEFNRIGFESDLATCLTRLSNHLSAAGDLPGAVVSAGEAVEILSCLAQENPFMFEPELAVCLNNFSCHLSAVGDHIGSLNPAQKALEIHRRLVVKNSAMYEPGLAVYLNNLSNRLSEIGDSKRAVDLIQEAVEIRRRLAKSDSLAFEPDLATSLNNLANLYWKLGDARSAIAPAQDAIEIRRRLVLINAPAYNFYLAQSLSNLAAYLGTIGDNRSASELMQEAIFIFKRLAETNSAAHEPELVRCLNNYAGLLSGLGDIEGGLRTAQEAVKISRRLKKTNPEAHTPALARRNQ